MGNLMSHITQIHKHKIVILLNVKKQWNSYLGVRIFIKSLVLLRMNNWITWVIRPNNPCKYCVIIIGAIDSVDEISKKEFPKRCIKRTKTEPEIQWSFNPQQDLSAYLMSREDILSEASREELPYLEAIIHGLQKDTSIEDDNIFGKI